MSVRYRASAFYTTVKFVSLPELKRAVNKIPNDKVFIIDEKVWHLYREPLQQLIGKRPYLAVKALETNKTFEQFTSILQKFSEWNISRNDSVVGIGGGITLDLTGFAASVFKRGCRLIFIPTTFVGMIDAAIGGKNGVNAVRVTEDSYREKDGVEAFFNPFPFTGQRIPETIESKISPLSAKNLIGTYYPANQVIICPQFLDTLSDTNILDGWAECIKTSLIIPNKLYQQILRAQGDVKKDIIRYAVMIKESLCRNDLYDRKSRRKLNLGHTFAHLIEAASNYEISHGKAVALGIRCAAKISLSMERITEQEFRRIVEPLEMFNFPKTLPEKYHRQIKQNGEETLLRDKKRTHNIKMVVFAGFQNTRVVSCSHPQQIIDTLISL